MSEDATRITALQASVTAYKTITPTDTQQQKDIGLFVSAANDESNRVAGLVHASTTIAAQGSTISTASWYR